jgi:hypothetical protein
MTPHYDDERAEKALHRLLESLGDATGVLLNLKEYLRALEARYRRLGVFVVRCIAIVGLGAVLSLIVVGCQIRNLEARGDRVDRAADRADTATERLERTAARNTKAIRVSCTLLSNAIIQSGAASPGGAPTAQGRLTGIYVGAINRELLTPAERLEVHRLQLIVAGSGGGGVTLPDCDEVARYPDAVQALLPAARRAPVRPNP